MKVPGRWAEPGRSMRKLREQCRLTRSKVARQTEEIAARKQDPSFHVSRSYLRDIELGNCAPSSYKLEALALIYNQGHEELLKLYGVTREDGGKLFTSFLSSSGSKLAIDVEEERRMLLAVAGRSRSKETRLLDMAEERLVIPAQWREFLEGKLRFAVIGTEDDSMGKLLSADCLVAVDTTQKTIEKGPWETDAERPIYLAWRNKGNPHVCCWAYQVGSTLTLLPYQPIGEREVTHWKAPTDAQIIGRVVHAWRLPLDVPQASARPDGKPKRRVRPDD